jgi:1-deoxy-D-xylulose-5-phosphate reductoisomerase
MTRRISVFGATGSIGQNTLDLIRRDRDRFRVIALTGGRNIDQLAADAREFGAEIAVTCHADCLADLRAGLAGTGVDVAAGAAAIAEAADRPADWIMSAIVGAAGLAPGFRALQHGFTLALANKESLVTAGPLLMAEAARHGSRILPVDSEHSAVFQALVGEEISTVERVIITASGGALRDWSTDRLQYATPGDASTHPNWDMGQRITIDSASMFNKALELIETYEFFGIAPANIETVIHPQSIIHALVGFTDGAMMAHLGAPDMRHAIGYALNWPRRRHLPVDRIDLSRIATLDFRPADAARYPALSLARDVMETGGHAGAVFNAAKEVALDHFIAKEIGFMDMAPVVADTMNAMSREFRLADAINTLETVTETDHLARIRAAEQASLRQEKRA